MTAAGSDLTQLPAERAAKRRALLDLLDGLRPALLAGAEEAEARGTLPMATVEALETAGFFRLKLPAVLGGAETDPVTYTEIIEGLAYIHTSAAWTTMTGATSAALMGAFLPDEAIEEIFPGGRVPLGAAVTPPMGTAERVSGGYRVSGTWSFGSGVPHAQWVCGGAFVEEPDGRRVHRIFAVPRDAVEVHDNWQVIGLRGTGSCDFTIAERFVPERFSWAYLEDPPRRGGPLYHIRAPGHTANEHAAVVLGTAQRALDAIVELAESKTSGMNNPRRLGARQVFQRMVGEATLCLQSVRMLTLDAYERAWATVVAGERVPPRLQAEMRGAAALATRVAVDVTTDAFRYSGGRALYESGILQRCLRDVQSAAQHHAVSDVAYENLGRFVLGDPDADPRT